MTRPTMTQHTPGPQKEGETMQIFVSFRLTPDVVAMLDKRAKAEERSRSSLLWRIVKAALQDAKSKATGG